MRTSDQVTDDLVEKLLNSTTSIMRWNCLSREERDEYLIYAQIHGINRMLRNLEDGIRPSDMIQAARKILGQRRNEE